MPRKALCRQTPLALAALYCFSVARATLGRISSTASALPTWHSTAPNHFFDKTTYFLIRGRSLLHAFPDVVVAAPRRSRNPATPCSEGFALAGQRIPRANTRLSICFPVLLRERRLPGVAWYFMFPLFPVFPVRRVVHVNTPISASISINPGHRRHGFR